VPNGDEVVPVINKITPLFDIVVTSQDWHPPNHCSFASTHDSEPFESVVLSGVPQMLWPNHCEQDTEGAAFHPDLIFPESTKTIINIQKGVNIDVDSYSAFGDNRTGEARQSTGLGDMLRERNVDTVYVAGLALDYCVMHTALDAIKEGFDTYLIQDACRAVDASEGASMALESMVVMGVKTTSSDTLLTG